MQRFEYHDDLSAHIERMANTGNTGSVVQWSKFLSELNNALSKEFERGQMAKD